MKITAKDFEDKVLAVEEVVIVIRAPAWSKVEDYDYSRKASGGTSVTDWLQTRVFPKLLMADDHDEQYEVVIVDGTHNTKPHGRTLMDTLRNSYEK